MHRAQRSISLLLVAVFLTGWIPGAPLVAAAAIALGASFAGDPPPFQPVSLNVPPTQAAPNPHLPSLALALDITPDPVVVGETATITLTIANGAPDPADGLVVTLPTPDGALALPGPGFLNPARGWEWNLGHLDGQAEATLTATLRLLRIPDGQALLAQPQATAARFATPVTAHGGAVAVSARGSATAHFSPDAPAELRSRDGRVSVRLPAHAANRRLTLRHRPLTDALPELLARGLPVPPAVAGFKRGLSSFALDATDDAGAAVHQFDAPLTISVGYTPEQLDAVGISEGSLTIYWFDEQQRRWIPLPTDVDRTNQIASAEVNHFSFYSLGNGASPSTTFIPSLEGWQVSQLTGSASYAYPIEVPAGAGGLKPQLQLIYDSAQTDSDAYDLKLKQASWVGKGWDLTTGFIALNKMTGPNGDYFSLVLDGKSHTIVRGQKLPNSNYTQNWLQGWTWYAADEQFLKVRAVYTGDYTSNGHTAKRFKWLVWTKGGTLYEFDSDVWWGWNDSGGGCGELEQYKWMLSKVTDPHGNTITYNYQPLQAPSSCWTVQPDIWPTTITWGANQITGAIDRYRVEFFSEPRRSDGSNTVAPAEDMDWDSAATTAGGKLQAPHETRKLKWIKVWSKKATTWEQVREYRFETDFSLYSDAYLCTGSSGVGGPCHYQTGTGFTADPTYRKLTLLSIQEVGKDGTLFPNNATPIKTTFTYETVRGVYKRANGGWNRLKIANNGQGGTLTFGYENISQFYLTQGSPYFDTFFNRHRVTSETRTDGQSNSYLTTYSYGEAQVNSLGSNNGGVGPNQFPNSAALFYWDRNGQPADTLAVPKTREFRGHASTTQKTYDGATTSTPLLEWVEHYFHQGDVGCTPAAAATSDMCFRNLRDEEFVKGRETLTVWKNPSGGKLKEVAHTYVSFFYPNTLLEIGGGGAQTWPEYTKNGLWHAFRFESQTDERTYEGGGTAKVKTTKHFYDTAYQVGGVQYGNLTKIEEYDGAALLRYTEHYFVQKDVETWVWNTTTNLPTYTINYLVDRVWMQSVRDSAARAGPDPHLLRRQQPGAGRHRHGRRRHTREHILRCPLADQPGQRNTAWPGHNLHLRRVRQSSDRDNLHRGRDAAVQRHRLDDQRAGGRQRRTDDQLYLQ
jgi:hypothetical protein